MKEFLKDYQEKGFIKSEEIGFDQVGKQLNRSRKELEVAEANLVIDSIVAYSCAYQAMLHAGRGLMFSYGYRPCDGEQHKTVVLFCENILGKDFAELVRKFDRMRKKRNQFTYDEPDILVSDTEAKNALESASEFVKKIAGFIEEKNPQKKLI